MVPCSHPLHRLEPLFPACDYITGHRFEVARCGGCGFIVTVPQPGADAMSTYYPEGYYGTQTANRFPAPVEWLQRRLYRRRAKWVQRFNLNRVGRVLDVGCGRGLLLREFQRQGWEVQGTELSEPAARYAVATLKLPVQIGSLEQLHFPSERFDAVVMWHVLEHVSDPRVILAEVHRVLRPGGMFMVGVPNFGSPEARMCRNKWLHLDVPRHLTHFTHASLREALARAGFTVRDACSFSPEYDCFSFVQSLLNRLGVRHNLLLGLLRRKGAGVLREEHSGALHLLATVLLSPLLGMLSVPVTTVAGLVGHGATITLLAVKNDDGPDDTNK
jgi:2-polyprenyl-3-methyl-5-hydroxy-6-metoxy-1,4-benzoquinol methylase